MLEHPLSTCSEHLRSHCTKHMHVRNGRTYVRTTQVDLLSYESNARENRKKSNG